MVDLIRAEVVQVVEQQTEDPLPRQALVGVAQNAILLDTQAYRYESGVVVMLLAECRLRNNVGHNGSNQIRYPALLERIQDGRNAFFIRACGTKFSDQITQNIYQG